MTQRNKIPASDLSRRRAAHAPRLRSLFTSLYGTDEFAAAQLKTIEAEIAAAAAKRPAHLRALDRAREADPAWYLGAHHIGYSCYVDRFAGSLAGLRARIPYLRELGVTYLHLLPFWQSRAGDSDGGFAVSDYLRVDPALGTNADLLALTRDLARANITLCADLVLNHTADDHAWARQARAGDANAKAYYRLFPDRTLPDAFETTLAQVFPDTAPGNFTFVPDLNAWAWTTFYAYQWDLNWENPAVLAAFVGIILDHANRGIGAFRLDSAPFLWKRLGTPCQNLPQTHQILQILRAAVDIAAPCVLLKAEAVVPARDLPAYVGLPQAPGTECHIAYQTSLMSASWASIAAQDTALLRQLLRTSPNLGQAGTWLTYVRCHDDIGWRVLAPECRELGLDPDATLTSAATFFTSGTTYARGRAFQANGLTATNGMAASLLGIDSALETGDQALLNQAVDRLVLLHALAFCAGGLPVIYMGDELGQTNDPAADPNADGRWLHRPHFDQAAALLAATDPGSLPAAITGRLKHLIRIRASLAALRADSPLALIETGSGALLAFSRGAGFLGLFNFSASAQDCAVAQSGFAMLHGHDAARKLTNLAGAPASATSPLPPWGFAWLGTAP